MIVESVRSDACLSYVVGCEKTSAAAVIDPELSQLDRYMGVASARGLRIRYVIDTHTHADHFSASRELSRRLGAAICMDRRAAAPFVDLRLDDGESVIVGELRLKAFHTPGHTSDSMCLLAGGHLFTGDTLLIQGTGRTDLPTGDPHALYDSLFGRILRLPDETVVHPAHDPKRLDVSTIGAERATNPRLQHHEREAFVALMRSLDLTMPRHLTEALRANRTGGKTVAQLIAEAAANVPFLSLDELRARIDANRTDTVLLDVREREAYTAQRIPGARNIPRGQLELRVDQEFPDPSVAIVAYCEHGRISTLAAATLRTLGYTHVVALDGGMRAWLDAKYPTERGAG